MTGFQFVISYQQLACVLEIYIFGTSLAVKFKSYESLGSHFLTSVEQVSCSVISTLTVLFRSCSVISTLTVSIYKCR